MNYISLFIYCIPLLRLSLQYDSFSIEFDYDSERRHNLQFELNFQSLHGFKNQSQTYTTKIDLNCFTSWIIPDDNMIENEYLHTISNAFGQFHAALLSGNKGLSNLLINQRIKWNNFTFIYITNVKGVLDVQNILGIGRDGAFQQYITEHYKTSMFAIDYQTKELFGGKRVEDLFKEKEVSRCKIIDPDFRKNTYGYMCNLEYVYFNKENKKQYKNVYRINEKNNKKEKIVYLDEIYHYENPFVSRFETMTDKIKVPKEFMAFLKDTYFKDKQCEYKKIAQDTYYICDEESYKKSSDIYFVFDGIEYKVPKTSLFIKQAEGNKYVFMMVVNDKVMSFRWLIGNRFLMNFTPIFDSPSQSIYFIKQDNSPFDKVYFSHEQRPLIPDDLSINLYIGIICINTVFSILLLYNKYITSIN